MNRLCLTALPTDIFVDDIVGCLRQYSDSAVRGTGTVTGTGLWVHVDCVSIIQAFPKNWEWWRSPVIPVRGRLRQEDL